MNTFIALSLASLVPLYVARQHIVAVEASNKDGSGPARLLLSDGRLFVLSTTAAETVAKLSSL